MSYRILAYRETIEPGDESLKGGAWSPAVGIGGTVGLSDTVSRKFYGWKDLPEGTQLRPGDEVRVGDEWEAVRFQRGTRSLALSSGYCRRPIDNMPLPDPVYVTLGPDDVIESGDYVFNGDWLLACGTIGRKVRDLICPKARRHYRFLATGETTRVGDEWIDDDGVKWVESWSGGVSVGEHAVGKVRRRTGGGIDTPFWRILRERMHDGLTQEQLAKIHYAITRGGKA